MKLIRYKDSNGAVGYAAQESETVFRRVTGDLAGGWTKTRETADVRKLLAPVEPSALLCIGLNYRHHAVESGMKIPEFPILFMKAPSAVQNPDDPIEIPRHMASDEVDYECELAVVIGKPGKNIARRDALKHVAGFTCGNDVSARDWQLRRGGGQWCRGKTFDTFCPLGPSLVTPDELGDPNHLGIRTLVGDEVVQDWNTHDMIFDVPTLIEFLSGSTTLQTGTVILTGTPQGVGMARKPPRWLKPGETVTVEIEKIGRLVNPVILEP